MVVMVWSLGLCGIQQKQRVRDPRVDKCLKRRMICSCIELIIVLIIYVLIIVCTYNCIDTKTFSVTIIYCFSRRN